MPKKKSEGQTRVRLVGVWASSISVVALSVTVLANNHSAGFSRVMPREEQMVLLSIAALLFCCPGNCLSHPSHQATVNERPDSIRHTEREN